MQTLDFEPSLIHKIYNLYLNTYGILQDFPKRSRYTLGEKIENSLLNLLELIDLANAQIKNLREPILHKASAKTGLLKLLFRLSYDLKLISDRQYVSLESQTREIERMIGGWIKFLRTY